MSSEVVGETVAGGGIRFLGTRPAYWRLLIRGAVLLMFTLGIYRFWLMTDVRRFLWSNTEIAGESLEYTGTPLELLIGFLMAIAILIPVYTGFFVAALDLGPLGKMSSVLAFLALFVLGQYATYRARRYRLTRTVFRGLRFHQEGSAWRYAFKAIFWWLLTILTLGLAYPFQLASLERYKMRNTYYGDLAGRFEGSGFRLLLRGLPMWLAVVAPLAIAIAVLITKVDWNAVGNAMSGAVDGTNHASETMAGRAGTGASHPDFSGGAIVIAILLAIASSLLALALYPAFQALTLRWWTSGLRFGEIEMRSKLRTRAVYGAYMNFLGHVLVFSMFMGMVASTTIVIASSFIPDMKSTAAQIVLSVVGLISYVISMLGYSTIYRGTAMLSLWQLGMESLQLSNVSVLDRVKANGTPASALGEGLADALHVGGF